MELRYLKCFQKVAELQHISHAADELHIAQPALSRIIRNLEEELGAELFERTGKSIHLNRNGEIVYQYAGEIFQTLDKMKAELSSQKDIQNSVIHLAFNSASCLIPALAAEFMQKNPGVSLQFANGSEKEEANVMFNIDSYYQILEQPEFQPLLKEEMLLVYAPTHRFASMQEITLEDLSGETFLFSKGCHSVYNITQSLCGLNDRKPPVMIECVSNETVLNFLDSGFGIALMPKVTWNLSAHPALQYRAIPGGPYYRTLYLQNMFQASSFAAGERFRKFCVEFFGRVQRIAAENDTCKKSILSLLAGEEEKG